MTTWANFKNFSEYEFVCRGHERGLCSCGGRADMRDSFMDQLQHLRNGYGRSMIVASGFRCAKYDKAIGGAGVHPTGTAADIKVAGEAAFHLLIVAYTAEMRGLGIKQSGPYAGRFIHLDTMISPRHPRPRIWSYP